MVILKLIRASRPDFVEGLCLLGTEPTQAPPGPLVIHDNRTNRMASAGDESFKFLTYQLPTLGDCPLSSETLEMLRSRRGRGGGEHDRGAFRHRGGHHPERTCTAVSVRPRQARRCPWRLRTPLLG